jgi:RNA polymerase sigma-70 factor, ECF subfamily
VASVEERLESRSEPPDEVLVVAAILGDFGAFDELVARYRAAVVRAARMVVGREDAEDVAQEVFLLAFKALPSIEDPAKFAAWLFAITRHRAWRFGRRESAHRSGRVELDEVLLERLESLSAPMPDRGDEEEVMLALASLPDDYALAVRLRFLDGLPIKRIAAFLGVSQATVKWRVHRGKQLLREQVEALRSRG